MSLAIESGGKSARIRTKAALIHEEAAELLTVPPRTTEEFETAFRKCHSVWHLWRSLVDDVSVDVPTSLMRNLARMLRDDCRLTLAGCSALRSPEGYGGFEDDLKLMDREMVNVASWLQDWPDDDATNHDLARASIAAGEFVSDEEFLAMVAK